MAVILYLHPELPRQWTSFLGFQELALICNRFKNVGGRWYKEKCTGSFANETSTEEVLEGNIINKNYVLVLVIGHSPAVTVRLPHSTRSRTPLGPVCDVCHQPVELNNSESKRPNLSPIELVLSN